MTMAWLAYTPDAPACAFVRRQSGQRSLCGATRWLPEIFAQSNAEPRPRCAGCQAELLRRERAIVPEGEQRVLDGLR